MIMPDIWFTLYSLANKGAIHSKTTITTRELGEILNVSQRNFLNLLMVISLLLLKVVGLLHLVMMLQETNSGEIQSLLM